MSRYRYIDKDKLLDNLNWHAPGEYKAKVSEVITNQPEVDVVEVVHCKDCRYYDEIYSSCSGVWDTGEYRTANVNESDYCSYGERKNEV